MQYDLDLPSANDARVLVCYCADRMMDRRADGPRLSTALSGATASKQIYSLPVSPNRQ